MRFKFQTNSVFLLSLLLYVSIPALAQEIDFLPESVVSASYEYKSTYHNSTLNGTGREPLLSTLLERNSIDEEDIDGTLAFRSVTHIIRLQYGLYDSLNLSLVLPYINSHRESNLKVADTGNTVHTRFADTYGSAETQGLGDVSLLASWRPVYGDTYDFRLRLELNGNNGSAYINDPDNVSLGNGANDLGVFLRWIIYSNSSSFSADLELGSVLTENTTLRQQGEEYEIKRGAVSSLSIDFSATANAWSYGGGLKTVAGGETHINNQEQNDNYLAYTYKLFVNFGNMYRLETETVNLPWTVKAYVENTFFGANAPGKDTFGLKALFYF